MKVIAFAASTSKHSINKQLVTYAASLLEEDEVEILDLNDFELPLFSVDLESRIGHPPNIIRFLEKLGSADALLISFAEHNGTYTAAYKSLFDWCSRVNPKLFQKKPMVLLSTSAGARGAKTVLAQAAESAPRFDGEVRATLSVPLFNQNFDIERGVLSNPEIHSQLEQALGTL